MSRQWREPEDTRAAWGAQAHALCTMPGPAPCAPSHGLPFAALKGEEFISRRRRPGLMPARFSVPARGPTELLPWETYPAGHRGLSGQPAAGSPTGGRNLPRACSPHRLCAWWGRRPGCRGLCRQGAQNTPASGPSPASAGPCPSCPCCDPGNSPTARGGGRRPRGTGRGTCSQPLGGLRARHTWSHSRHTLIFRENLGWRLRRGTRAWRVRPDFRVESLTVQ